MPSEQLDKLVQQLETYAQSHPNEYKWRVGWLAALGYGYFVLLFALLIALIVVLQVTGSRYTALSSSDLNSLAFIICFFVISMLGIDFSSPEGLYLTRVQAPKLFSLIDELTKRLDTVKFHHVIINDEVNAGVLQVQRVGILGWQTNYLYLGLPLMQALSTDQFHAVLSHEFAHLSNHDSRFSNWIYRLRYQWLRLKDTPLLHPLVKWYVPFFNAYSFVFARMNEYAADRCAGRLVSEEAKSHALIQLYLTDALLRHNFWEKLTQQVRFQLEPLGNTISQQLEVIQTGASSPELEAWLNLELIENTNNHDTHPCLRERIFALKCIPQLPPMVSISAASYFLEDNLTEIVDKLDAQWQTEHRGWCKNLYSRSQREQIQLDAIARKENQQSLSVSEQWQQVKLTFDLHGKDAAIPLLEKFLEQEPHHIAANYMFGKLLIQLGEEQGLAYLETVIKHEPIYAASCCELAYIFLQKQGDKSQAKQYLERLCEYKEQWQKSSQERGKIDAEDLFLPHDLTSTELGELALQLAKFPEIQAAYLVRKQVNYFPESPLYVLAIIRRFWRSPDGSFYRYEHLGGILLSEATFPQKGEWVTKILSDSNKNLGESIRKIKLSAIYRYQS